MEHGVTEHTTNPNQVDCAAVSRGFVSISPEGGNCYRIKESVASTITDLNETFSFSSTSSKTQGGGINYSNFYFNGIPDGKYSLAHTSLLSRIIDALSQIADYLIGILTYVIRMVIVGWTAIFDNLFNWTVNTVVDTGVEAEEVELDINPVQTESVDNDSRLTIENLLFNKYELTDVNIFK